MFNDILGILSNVYTTVFDWFYDFVGNIPGMLPFVFALIGFCIVYRFLINPVFSASVNFHSASDAVKKSKGSK